jgi:hypothetical protein
LGFGFWDLRFAADESDIDLSLALALRGTVWQWLAMTAKESRHFA